MIWLNYLLKVNRIETKVNDEFREFWFFKDNKRPFTKPSILEQFSDVDVNEGSPLILKCRINHGYPKARVLWYKENTLIQPNDHYKLCKFNIRKRRRNPIEFDKLRNLMRNKTFLFVNRLLWRWAICVTYR